MAGPEWPAINIASRLLFTESANDFFFKWKIDERLLAKLKTQVNSAKEVLQVAEMKLIEDKATVNQWLLEARSAIFDAEDLLDKIATDAAKVHRRLGDSASIIDRINEKLKYKRQHIARAVRPSKKTREDDMRYIIGRLQFLMDQRDHLKLENYKVLTIYKQERVCASYVNDTVKICGRSRDKKKLMKLLDSREGEIEAFQVIPIVGLAGVGKTTLACMVFHECKSLNYSSILPSSVPHLMQPDETSSVPIEFDVKAWVCLSKGFKVTNIIKSLLKSITGNRFASDDDLGFLQKELKKQLRGKKFLFVLDDIWNDIDKKWDNLRTPFLIGKPGSRIIVTTRSIDVAKTMTNVPIFVYQLQEMSYEESLSLFKSVAFPGGDSSGASRLIIQTGALIVKKCEGLPLAVKMIGKSLLLKDYDEWRRVLYSDIWDSSKDILPPLLLSYYNLPWAIKQCFAYLSIFPKDYSFSMEEVVMLWVAEGLIEKPQIEQYEDVARGYYTHLLSNFFIQENMGDDVSSFVLHDLVHDLAKYVSRGLCVDWPHVYSPSRRLSYIRGKGEVTLSKSEVQKLRHVRTFLPLRKNQYDFETGLYLDNKFLNDILSNFKLLRVLSLEGYALTVLPASVGDLKLLRYLNLSKTEIDILPHRICRLYNLQFLDVSRCWRLKRLPSNIDDLVNLRYLNVEWAVLKEIPDAIGRMTSLQMLPELVLGKEKLNRMKVLKDLTNLHGKLQLSGLNNITNTKHVVTANIRKKKYLEELVLDWGLETERDTILDVKVLDAIQAHENLKELTVKWYGGKRLSNWIVGVTPYSNIMMTSLCITNCFNLETLPSLGNLPILKNLTIEELPCIKSLGGEFYGGSGTPFPFLEILIIKGLEVLETWSFPGGDGQGFPSLKELQISMCPMLTEIPPLGSLGLLKELCLVGLECLKLFDEGFYGNGCRGVVFPALEKLKIGEMKVLKTWSVPGGNRGGFPSLKKLEILCCPELRKIPMCFPSLTDLIIVGCDKLFGPDMCGDPSLGNLRALKHLSIKDVNCLESLNEGFYGDDCDAPFPALEDLKICHLEVLKKWLFPRGDNRRRGFASLKELQIEGCFQLRKIPFCFPCLTKLDISHCSNLVEFEMFGGEEEPVCYGHSLRSLHICWCPELKDIPKSFANLATVNIHGLHSLVSLPKLHHVQMLKALQVGGSSLIEAAQDSTYLEELEMGSDYSNLAVKLLSLDLNRLTSLSHLKLVFPDVDCEKEIIGREDCDEVARLPPNLSYLRVTGGNLQIHTNILSSLTSPLIKLEFCRCHPLESFPDVELPSTLKSLKIESCDALRTISNQFLNGCSKSLQEMSVIYCPNLECLPPSLSTLQSIQNLRLHDCGALKSLPDGFHNIASLETLTLLRCRNLVIPEEYGFPATLIHLTIIDCGMLRPISKMKLPKLTSLTSLDLQGFPETFTLDSCLPESIENLTIKNFPHLQSLSRLLPTLKYLKVLDVSQCPLVNQKQHLSKKLNLIPRKLKSWVLKT